jgi:hypothetical protein
VRAEDGVVTDPALPSVMRMRLRYAGACGWCGQMVPAGQWGGYDRVSRQVSCLACADRGEPALSGVAGNVVVASGVEDAGSDVSITSVQGAG